MTHRIADIEAIPFVAPLHDRQAKMRYFATRKGRQNILVRIRTDDGLEGFGDAVTAPYVSGETATGAKALIDDVIGPALVGLRALEVNTAVSRMNSLSVGTSATHRAVDVALYDLAAKALDVPVSDLLGGAVRTRLPAILHLHSLDTETDCEMATRAITDGFTALKVKVGKARVSDDVDRLAAIRAAVGDDVRITVDANQGWQPAAAIAFARAARELGVVLIEQPVPGWNLAGMTTVVAAGGPAVGADEGVRTATDVHEHARLGAANAIVLKLLKSGGFHGARKVVAVAEAAGLDILVGGYSGETGLSTAAALHLAAAIDNLPFGVALPSHYVQQDIVTAPAHPHDGVFDLPPGLGLGMDVDMDAVQECRIGAL